MQSDRTPCCVGGRDVLEIQGVGGMGCVYVCVRSVCVCVSTPTAAAEKLLFNKERKKVRKHYSHACVMAYL